MTPAAAVAPSSSPSPLKQSTQPTPPRILGLTVQQAETRLRDVGPNALPDSTQHPWRRVMDKLWAPVPWMLEGAIVLQLAIHKYAEASIIAALLVFNAAVGFFQEGRAEATLRALKSKLALNASVLRGGIWKLIPAAQVVPGDTVKLSLGAIVPADITIDAGSVLLDQSMLTGESVPVEAGVGVQSFAGALVRRGEATASVTQTGARTKFGHTAELVRTAHVVSSQQTTVLRLVRNLALLNGVLIVALTVYAMRHGLSFSDTLPLVLTAILAAIPVALPATFTLATALGARALAKVGVLSTRLSAVDEAATMEILCVDKTGTLTRNELSVALVKPMPGFSEDHVLILASLASDEGGQDPVDAAIRNAAANKSKKDSPTLLTFAPFDPAKKLSEATATDAHGQIIRIVKGAYATVIALAAGAPSRTSDATQLELQGNRVLAIVAGPVQGMKLVGLIALNDPPRSDAAGLIHELSTLGVRAVMVTGDAETTAGSVARAVGLSGAVCPPGELPKDLRPEQYGVFAGIYPEGKFALIKALQAGSRTVGMCGDGANDAPALRQAQIGIAVSTATDVAKSAAGMVLTRPGLDGVVAAIKEGRSAFQRILTYTLNSVTKKIVNVLFLFIGLVITGQPILTPMLMVIIMITGDFLGMSITTDNVRPSLMPNRWQIGKLTLACSVLAFSLLAFCTTALLIGKYWLGADVPTLQTLAVVVLVFGGEATLYSVRERNHLWSSRPGRWVIIASVADLIIISTLAIFGIAMRPLPIRVVGGVLAAALLFALIVDRIKVPTFRRLQIA